MGETTSFITSAISSVGELLGAAMDTITGNEVMLVFLGISLVCGGFRVFRKGKKAAM